MIHIPLYMTYLGIRSSNAWQIDRCEVDCADDSKVCVVRCELVAKQAHVNDIKKGAWFFYAIMVLLVLTWASSFAPGSPKFGVFGGMDFSWAIPIAIALGILLCVNFSLLIRMLNGGVINLTGHCDSPATNETPAQVSFSSPRAAKRTARIAEQLLTKAEPRFRLVRNDSGVIEAVTVADRLGTLGQSDVDAGCQGRIPAASGAGHAGTSHGVGSRQ